MQNFRAANKLNLKHYHKKTLTIYGLLIFSVVGMVMIFSSRAATPPSVIEAENGTITAPAVKITNSTTSAGSAVKFGAASQVAKTNFLFGVGDYAGTAATTRIVTEAPIKMLTNWYSDPSGLQYLPQIRTDALNFTSQGYAMHLMVWNYSDTKTTTQTAYGPACGVAYPISSRFNDDMRQVAQAYAGTKLYVTMFFEVQAYSCGEQQWKDNEAYFKALQDSYKQALATFHQYAPGSKISIGWGGWLTTWDDPTTGLGTSMLPYFSDVLNMSDFQSYGAVASGAGANLQTVQQLTPLLHAYGNKPVMITPFGRYAGDSTATWPADMQSILNDTTLTRAINNGLFAIDLYKYNNLTNETDFQYMKSAVNKYTTWQVVAP